jgi:predicted nucleic acid-binding protein
MILLDTNVVSELMRPIPEPVVLVWLDRYDSQILFISAITEAEILRGIALLPEGKRRTGLAEITAIMFTEDFADRRLPFDSAAACQYAGLTAHCQSAGRPISVEDAQIAAIALCHGLALATRNTRDFETITGLTLLNPWRIDPPVH